MNDKDYAIGEEKDNKNVSNNGAGNRSEYQGNEIEPIFVVEKIINHRICHKRLQFFLKWVGYPKNYNSWEDFVDLKNRDLLLEYREKVKAEKGVDIYSFLATSQYNPQNPPLADDGLPVIDEEDLKKSGVYEELIRKMTPYKPLKKKTSPHSVGKNEKQKDKKGSVTSTFEEDTKDNDDNKDSDANYIDNEKKRECKIYMSESGTNGNKKIKNSQHGCITIEIPADFKENLVLKIIPSK